MGALFLSWILHMFGDNYRFHFGIANAWLADFGDGCG